MADPVPDHLAVPDDVTDELQKARVEYYACGAKMLELSHDRESVVYRALMCYHHDLLARVHKLELIVNPEADDRVPVAQPVPVNVAADSTGSNSVPNPVVNAAESTGSNSVPNPVVNAAESTGSNSVPNPVVNAAADANSAGNAPTANSVVNAVAANSAENAPPAISHASASVGDDSASVLGAANSVGSLDTTANI